jgi:hypothetical protein
LGTLKKLNSNLTCGTSIWGRSLLIRQIFIKRRVIFNANRLTTEKDPENRGVPAFADSQELKTNERLFKRRKL